MKDKFHFILLLLTLASCAAPLSGTRTAIRTKPPVPSDWQSRWLKGVPCRAPCWEGITPGQTSATEAVGILEQNPLFSNIEKESSSAAPQYGDIRWKLSNGDFGGAIYYDPQVTGEPIYLIAPSLSQSFRFGDIINVYGEPSHVVASAEHLTGEVHGLGRQLQLIYQPQGFAVQVPAEKIPTILDPDMLTVRPIFFVPTALGRMEAIPAPLEFVSDWQGFKEYAFYCRDSEGGKACRGD